MISILLAAYNGELFISEQLESLLRQTFQDFVIYIRDDRSTDSTSSIIQKYADQYPQKIFIAQNEKNIGGSKHNFIKMMMEHKDDYVMLCDQDDVWLPDKIEKSLDKIQEIEMVYGKSEPALVHSDLTVVDERLNIISNSVLKEVLSDCSKTSLNKKIIQNTITGCTAMYNRALANLISEPQYMIMHDWWILLIAAAFGKIGTIYEPTILYRQHENNDIGAKKKQALLEYVFYKLTHYRETADAINQTYLQANSFLLEYGDRLPLKQREMLTAFSSIPTMSKLGRLKTIFKYKTFRHGFARKAAQVFVACAEL